VATKEALEKLQEETDKIVEEYKSLPGQMEEKPQRVLDRIAKEERD